MEMKRPEHHSGGVPAVSQGWNWWLVEWLYVARGNLNDAMTPITPFRGEREQVCTITWKTGVMASLVGRKRSGAAPGAGPDGVRRLRRPSP